MQEAGEAGKEYKLIYYYFLEPAKKFATFAARDIANSLAGSKYQKFPKAHSRKTLAGSKKYKAKILESMRTLGAYAICHVVMMYFDK